jgi:hypothetical protein
MRGAVKSGKRREIFTLYLSLPKYLNRDTILAVINHAQILL